MKPGVTTAYRIYPISSMFGRRGHYVYLPAPQQPTEQRNNITRVSQYKNMQKKKQTQHQNPATLLERTFSSLILLTRTPLWCETNDVAGRHTGKQTPQDASHRLQGQHVDTQT